MKAHYKGVHMEGTPQEICGLIHLLGGAQKHNTPPRYTVIKPSFLQLERHTGVVGVHRAYEKSNSDRT